MTKDERHELAKIMWKEIREKKYKEKQKYFAGNIPYEIDKAKRISKKKIKEF